MADHQDDALLGRTESQETVRTPGRSSMSDAKIAGITLLFCVLLAGQGLTAYFLINQKGQITTLEQNTDRLKVKLSHRPPVSSGPKMLHMPMHSMPLLMDLSSDKKETPMTKLENTVMVSLEKQVKDLLQDPQLPQFNETFLANLQGLKKQMEEGEWKGFESWMHYWLLFQMAQQKPPAPTPIPGEATTALGASKIQTKCQLEAAGVGSVRPGHFRPQCDEQGNYLPMQCWHSTGYCWCVDKNGVQIPNTLVRGRPVCGGTAGPDQMMAMPSLSRMLELKDD